MKVFAEKETEKFLHQEGFEIVSGHYVEEESGIRNALFGMVFPVVLKVSGKTIIHKSKVGGIKLGVKNFDEALKAFRELKKIKGFERVLIQEQISGKEFLLGVKKTPEFGFVVGFGTGGPRTEELKDVSFRVCDFGKDEAVKMINETKIGEKMSREEIELVSNVLIKLCRLVEEFPEIKALDINPLIIEDGRALVVDAQVVFR